MKSNMNHKFSEVPQAKIPRSSFDRSHSVKTTFDSGYIVPIFVDEVLPGDTFNCRTAGLCRLATPLFPTMDNMYMDTFYFSVPIRLIWDNFQKFMGEQTNPGDSTDYLIPKISAPAAGGWTEQSLQDYLGLPTKIDSLQSSALYTRAYNLIYNEWFRDQNLQDSLVVDKDDGPDDPNDYTLVRRGKRHDYFTSALPWPQKGTAVELPLGTSAPVSGTVSTDISGTSTFQYTSGGGTPEIRDVFSGTNGSNIIRAGTDWVSDGNDPLLYHSGLGTTSTHSLTADLSSATSATINQLRQAFQVQRMYETDARSGTRYTEVVRAHFGVTSPDARLQRPEYLGGGSTPVSITPVPATNGNTSTVGLGTLGGYGVGHFNGHGFTKSFTEHCIVLGFVNVRADLTYQQGLNRMFSRDDRLDYYWPSLSVIGEQTILNKEIYAAGTSVDDDVFGYQERYAEYRYKPSTIHGLMRSNATQSLDPWHLSQDFASLPALSPTFIEDDPPIDRIVKVPTQPDFIGDFYHKLITARPMPLYGIPGGVERF